MKSIKMKQTKLMEVILLPTEKVTNHYSALLQGQHLYIVSDNELEDRDLNGYAYDKRNEKVYQITPVVLNNNKTLEYGLKLVVATTDNSLHCKQPENCNSSLSKKCICPDKLPQIPQSFIEEYVKAEGKINEVEVEMEEYQDTINYHKDIWKNFARIKTRPDNTIIIHLKNEVIKGTEAAPLSDELGKQYKGELSLHDSANGTDYLIFKTGETVPVLITLMEGVQETYRNKDEVKALCERIVECVNGWDELQKSVKYAEKVAYETSKKNADQIKLIDEMREALQNWLSIINRTPAAMYHYEDAIIKTETILSKIK